MDRRELWVPNLKGCTAHNCIFRDNSTGAHTNSLCSCERELFRNKQGSNAIKTIRFLRKQIVDEE